MPKYQIEMTDDRLNELEKLMDECGLKTKEDFLNNAISLLEWAVNERKKGNTIGSIDDKNQKIREVQIPIFDRIKPTQ